METLITRPRVWTEREKLNVQTVADNLLVAKPGSLDSGKSMG
jgi:hypothetical protein